MRLTRRDLLVLGTTGVTGCILPSRSPPRVDHPAYPIGPIPRHRYGQATGLFAGAASIDITPPAGAWVWLAGYGFQRRMERVRDPISARCLYLDDGERRIALVVADVIGLLLPTVERVRRLVGNGIEVAVASTHNHQGPDTMGYWGEAILYTFPCESGIDPAYQRVLERRLAASVKLAAERAEPARLWMGRGRIPNGLVRNLRTPGVIDPAIQVVEARARRGNRVLCSLVNLGCHPETLGDRARLLSADFPGVLRSRVEQERGGTALFCNGALGGMITAALDGASGVRERIAFMQEMGGALARTTLEAVKDAVPAATDTVRYTRCPVEVQTDNELFVTMERIGLVEPHQRSSRGGYLTEVGRIDLGPAAWALVPGEPTPKVGLRIKEQLSVDGAEYPAVIALANDELGYLLDPVQYDDPEFSYEVSVSVGRDAATVIEEALRKCRPT